MTNKIERQLSEIEKRLHLGGEGDWCAACVHEQRFQILYDDEPEACCPECGRVLGPLEGTRVIRIVLREDGPQ
ncbi:MAG TPA: hypothetical protein VGR22_08735 [Thermomicrobiales bacterium]|nr:hypothetical protein [Thermomicrobiales bacterium]